MDRSIYWAWDEAEDNSDEEECRYLVYETKTEYYDFSEEATLSNTTLEQLANFLDQEAESSNQHSFVGVHRGLAALLYFRFQREAATSMLFSIARHGGLMELGEARTLKSLGVEKCWGDFVLPQPL